MFGEYESESPRVPSPWDSLISSPRSLSPLNPSNNNNNNGSHFFSNDSTTPSISSTPSPLLLPRLVPENDSGNVEYKLQLLNPSPARFTRLVTQLKWRLLEGGGQAYYELGVADSGDLVGLGRAELEASLDTLEMMAGEIGASVIIVKEIEVPAGLAESYRGDAKMAVYRGRRGLGDVSGEMVCGKKEGGLVSYGEVVGNLTSSSSATNTEKEEDEAGLVMDDGGYEDMGMTIVLERRTTASPEYPTQSSANDDMFVMDSEEFESDSTAETADASEADEDRLSPPSQARYIIDLEISSVYKPRPMRKRFHHVQHLHHHHHHHLHHTQVNMGGKKGKKEKNKQQQPLPHNHDPNTLDGPSGTTASTSPTTKCETAQQRRDRRRAERKQAQPTASDSVVHDYLTHPAPSDAAQTDALVGMLESLHVDVEPPLSMPLSNTTENPYHNALMTAEKAIVATAFTTTTTMTSATTKTVITDSAAVSSASISIARNSLGDVSHTEEGVIKVKIEDEDESVDDGDSIFGSPTTTTTAAIGISNAGTADSGGRLIVEVLVVKKLSIEEGFLDFEGFSLS